MKNLVDLIIEHEAADTVSTTYLFSQVFKRQRKKQNMTLEEASKGICSISYLSKMENLQIDEVENSYIRKLCERVSLDYQTIVSCECIDDLQTIILNYFLGNYSQLEKYYMDIGDSLDSARNDLIRGFYYLANRNYEQVRRILKFLDEIKSSLRQLEVYAYAILTIEFGISFGKIYSITDLYNQLKNLDCRYKIVNWALYYQGLRIAFQTNNLCDFYHYYHLITNIDDLNFPNDVVVTSKAMRIILEIEDGHSYSIPDIYLDSRLVGKHYDEDYSYYKSIILYLNKEYQRMINYIKINDLQSELRFFGLLALGYSALGDKDRLKVIEANLKMFEYSTCDVLDKNFITYIFKKNDDNQKDQLTNYIKENLLPYQSIYTNHLYKMVVEKDYLDLIANSTKYKETTKYLLEKYRSKK